MPTTLNCACGRSMSFRDELAGMVQRCIYCGAPLRIEPPAFERPDASPTTPPSPPAVSAAVPWEEPAATSTLAAWWRTYFRTLFRPAPFFDALGYEGARGATTYYAAGVVQAMALPTLLMALSFIMMLINPTLTGRGYVEGTLGLLLALFPLALGGAFAILLLCAGTWHLCVRAAGGTGPFVATYRAVAYASGSVCAPILAVCGAVPFCVEYREFGWLIPLVMLAALHPLHLTLALTTAFARGHKMSHGRALAATLAPILWVAVPAVTGGLLWAVARVWYRYRYYSWD